MVAAVIMLAGCPGDLSQRDYSGGSADSRPPVGANGGPCFSNGTCNSGLTCRNGTCLYVPDIGGTPTPDTGQPDRGVDQQQPVQDWSMPQLDKGGPVASGFGDRCTQSKPCAAPMTCAVLTSGAAKGYCTKVCTKSGAACTGGPTGTLPYCLLKDAKNNYYCAFLCKYKSGSKNQTAPCPSQLTCSTQQFPAGSGQHICQ